MADSDPPAASPNSEPPAPDLDGLDPAELLARGLNSVKPSDGTSGWEPPTVEEVGRLLPQYRIEKLLGRGGMGAVYKGIQLNLDRPVAIKLLPAEIAADAQFVVRFEREARTLARLQHPRIVTIHDFGQTSEGHLYFVMEYVDGTDLRRVLKEHRLDSEQALAVVGQLCDALQAAHREGIVHRDIKPENVLITHEGYVKLADFGLARPPREEDAPEITRTNVVMGTPQYMSPEQFFGAGHADHRSDIFALGVMFYEMLTGQTPRGVFDPPSSRMHGVQVDVRIDEVVLKALQSAPDRRYQMASEMKSDLERIQSTPSLPASPSPGSSPKIPEAPAVKKGSKMLLPAAVAVVLLLCLATYVFWPKRGQPSSPGGTASAPAALANGIPPTPSSLNAPSTADTLTSSEPATLEEALLSYHWHYFDHGHKEDATIQFHRDGTISPGYIRWAITGPRTALLQWQAPGNVADIAFDEHFKSFVGTSRDPENMPHSNLNGSRQERVVLAEPLRPGAQEKLRAALLSSGWSWDDADGRITGKVVHFLADGTVVCNNGGAWHWVISGSQSVHCIWRNPAEFMDLTFDSALTHFACTDQHFNPAAVGHLLDGPAVPESNRNATSSDDPIVGIWHFYNGDIRKFFADGKCNGGNRGQGIKNDGGWIANWTRDNPNQWPAKYKIRYLVGDFLDEVTLDSAHAFLEGRSNHNEHVTAKRMP